MIQFTCLIHLFVIITFHTTNEFFTLKLQTTLKSTLPTTLPFIITTIYLKTYFELHLTLVIVMFVINLESFILALDVLKQFKHYLSINLHFTSNNYDVKNFH